jgi:hypothetical protein
MISRPRLPLGGEIFPVYIPTEKKLSHPHRLMEEFSALNRGLGPIAISIHM